MDPVTIIKAQGRSRRPQLRREASHGAESHAEGGAVVGGERNSGPVGGESMAQVPKRLSGRTQKQSSLS